MNVSRETRLSWWLYVSRETFFFSLSDTAAVLFSTTKLMKKAGGTGQGLLFALCVII